MRDLPDIDSSKVSERIEATAFELHEDHPEGLQWADLNRRIELGFSPEDGQQLCLETGREVSRSTPQPFEEALPIAEVRLTLVDPLTAS